MAINTVDDIASSMAIGQKARLIKNFSITKTAGAFHSGWLASGLPVAGATPPLFTAGAGYTCDRTTVGAIGQINAAVQNWLMQTVMGSTQVGTLFIADRLWSCSGMGFAAATYTVTTPGSLPARITDFGAKAELWVEQFVAASTATGTLSASYLDSAGVAQTGVIPAVVSAPNLGQMQRVTLANNLGIRQLTSVTNSATWTSGTWGMTILETIAQIELPVIGISKSMDWATLGLPQIKQNSCLFLYFLANGSSSPTIIGSLNIGDK